MKLINYDIKYVGKIIGLENPGISICYFNSMLQALFSCSAFNQLLTKKKQQLQRNPTNNTNHQANQHDQTELIEEYLRLCCGDTISSNSISLNSSKHALDLLIRARNNYGGLNLVANQQEDMHLGLGVFLDLVGGADKLFKIKHKTTIHCNNCNNTHKSPDNSTPYECGIIVDNINTKQEMENCIKGEIEMLDDYRCENCNAMGPGVIYRKTKLVRISEILIVILNKARPGRKYFSEELDFYSEPLQKNLHYKVVAQIEHLGNVGGGHYMTLARRKTPPDLNKNKQEALVSGGRMIKLEQEYKTLLQRYKTAKDGYKIADPEIKEDRKKYTLQIKQKIRAVEMEIAKINKEIELSKEIAREKMIPGETDNTSVLLFDDNKINHVENFAPTINTYIVIYHLT